jgi:hypothetical protein
MAAMHIKLAEHCGHRVTRRESKKIAQELAQYIFVEINA